jgi:hypothetical protein
MQIAKFKHPADWFTRENVTTVYGLLLEPTNRTADEYRRIGIAEIPQKYGMADVWDSKVVGIV